MLVPEISDKEVIMNSKDALEIFREYAEKIVTHGTVPSGCNIRTVSISGNLLKRLYGFIDPKIENDAWYFVTIEGEKVSYRALTEDDI